MHPVPLKDLIVVSLGLLVLGALIAGVVFVQTLLFKWFWNSGFAGVSKLPTINFWQALGVMLFADIVTYFARRGR